MILDLHPGNVVAIGVLLPLVATVAMALRFYTRRIKHVSLKEDDWTMLAGLVLVWGLGIAHIVGASLGALGVHSPPPPPPEDNPRGNTITRGEADEHIEKIVLGYSVIEKVAFGLIKISVLLAYRRIFRGKVFNVVSIAMIVVCTLLAIAFIITSAFQCHVRNWSLQYLGWSHRRHCIQAQISWAGFAITDVTTDIIILALPIPLVFQLQMSLSKKVNVSLIFLLGLLSTAVGVIRMAVVLYFVYGTNRSGYRDLLATIATVLVWSIVEASVAVVASCLPAIRPLITKTEASDAYSSGISKSDHRSTASPAPLRQNGLYEFDDLEDRRYLSPAMAHNR